VPGVVTIGISEQNQRGFYRRWAEFMAAQSWADLVTKALALGT
jgi:3-phenylpropionate/trans-cinnamate dioxygenase alpha subunit